MIIVMNFEKADAKADAAEMLIFGLEIEVI